MKFKKMFKKEIVKIMQTSVQFKVSCNKKPIILIF